MFGELTPRVFRRNIYTGRGRRDALSRPPRTVKTRVTDDDPFADDRYRAFYPSIEREIIEQFKRDAHNRGSESVPADGDHLGWLCQLQHHGAPTRLLDWSEQALVALYFVVREEPSRDGELWALEARTLNGLVGAGDGYPLPGFSGRLDFLATEPYHGPPEEALQRYKLNQAQEKPIAFRPIRTFARMTAQASVFTIHPVPRAACMIAALVTYKSALVRYRIRASAKEKLRLHLADLGVSEHTLFPDRAALGARVAGEVKYYGWNNSRPPKCGGIVDKPDDVRRSRRAESNVPASRWP